MIEQQARALRLAWRRRKARLFMLLKRYRRLVTGEVIIVSHAKSGRTWLITQLSSIYHQLYGIDERLIIKAANFKKLDARIPNVTTTHDSRKSETNNELAGAWIYRHARVILLVRDPRDIAVSWWFHHLKRRQKRGQPIGDDRQAASVFVLARLPEIVAFFDRWDRKIDKLPNSMILRYEDMRLRPEQELARILTFLGEHASKETVARAVAFASLDSMREKERTSFFKSGRFEAIDGDEEEGFKVREGAVGGYVRHLEPESLAAIDALIDRPSIARFGYRAEVLHGSRTPTPASRATA